MTFHRFALFLFVLLLLPFKSNAQNPSEIDFMMFYTPDSRDVMGGTSAIRAAIRDAVIEANEMFLLSETNTHFNLINSVEIDYNESNVNTDYARFKGENDGIMDNVHEIRNRYGADMSGIIVTSPSTNAAGLGNVPNQQEVNDGDVYATSFHLLTLDYLLGTGNLSHELGHGLGLGHTSSDNSTKSYGHSFTFTGQDGNRYSTNMAMPPRIMQFSNPNVMYQGRPTGNSNNNAALAISEVSPTYEDFFPGALHAFPDADIVQPFFGTEFTTSDQVPLEINLINGNIQSVTYYANDVEIASTSVPPFSETWNNPTAGNYNIHAKLVSTDGMIHRTFSHPVAIEGPNILPAPYMQVPIFFEGSTGTTTFDGSLYRTVANGNNQVNNADDVHFVYVPVVGDGIVTARFMAINGNSNGAFGGVMVRANLHNASSQAMVIGDNTNSIAPRLLTDHRTIHFGVRELNYNSGNVTRPYLRIEREGDLLRMSYSQDGNLFTSLGITQIYLPDTAYFGMVVAGDGSAVSVSMGEFSVEPKIVPIVLRESLLPEVNPNLSGYVYNLKGQIVKMDSEKNSNINRLRNFREKSGIFFSKL